jgi:hypothetical protein
MSRETQRARETAGARLGWSKDLETAAEKWANALVTTKKDSATARRRATKTGGSRKGTWTVAH